MTISETTPSAFGSTTLQAAGFITHIAAAAQALADHKDDINRLNVFPVPDGDTGTNMSLTMENVMHELANLGPNPTRDDLRKAVTHGSLMGARGNSGVITSQILRGICDGLASAEHFDSATISAALVRAVEVAFSAVRKPVEGTILTVLRDTADKAQGAAEAGLSLTETLVALSSEAFASVNRTPDLLPVLKENGVVDAGGYGFALMIEGFVNSVVTADGAETLKPQAIEFGVRTEPKIAIEQINDWEGSSFLYCTEFLFNSQDIDVEAAHDFLASMGDCELLVGAHPDFKVHVHTNEPGTVLSYMTERGHIADVHIHNMRLQSQERTEGLASEQETETSFTLEAPEKSIGFIAVASGEGMENILRSLGVDIVVSGGQTMNPSTQDLLEAIDRVNAPNVIIFPNNKNIILASNAAAQVSEKTVEVVGTKSVPESFSALFLADETVSLQDNVTAMREAIERVHSGEVTQAIKDATANNGQPIRNGDIIGIADDSIEVVGNDLAAVALDLIGLLSADADTLTILAGKDLRQDDFTQIIARIEELYPELEIDSHRGEQPLYPLVMAAE